MAENTGGYQFHGCYSQLLEEYNLGFTSSHDAKNMLCFGDSNSKQDPETPIMITPIDSETIPGKKGSESGCQPAKKIVSKKSKSSANQHARVGKKERLGEKINVLQQLVSPYGKTDTASVLQEAIGYIKFLQDQVQVLCSPYLQCIPKQHEQDEGNKGGDLSNIGLCLVPVEVGRRVASEPNGADFWSSLSTGYGT